MYRDTDSDTVWQGYNSTLSRLTEMNYYAFRNKKRHTQREKQIDTDIDT